MTCYTLLNISFEFHDNWKSKSEKALPLPLELFTFRNVMKQSLTRLCTRTILCCQNTCGCRLLLYGQYRRVPIYRYFCDNKTLLVNTLSDHFIIINIRVFHCVESSSSVYHTCSDTSCSLFISMSPLCHYTSAVLSEQSVTLDCGESLWCGDSTVKYPHTTQ